MLLANDFLANYDWLVFTVKNIDKNYSKLLFTRSRIFARFARVSLLPKFLRPFTLGCYIKNGCG